MDKRKREEAPIKVYKPSLGKIIEAWIRAIWFLFIGIPMTLILALMGGIALLFFLMVILLMFEAVWYAIMLTKHFTLTIYEDGIELQRGQSRFFCDWENMNHLARFRWSDSRYGIHLYQAVELEERGFIERYFFGNAQRFINITEILFIGGNIFQNDEELSRQLLNKEFGQILLHYAPHLFEYDEEKAKNS